jgi:hypothetical protein
VASTDSALLAFAAALLLDFAWNVFELSTLTALAATSAVPEDHPPELSTLTALAATSAVPEDHPPELSTLTALAATSAVPEDHPPELSTLTALAATSAVPEDHPPELSTLTALAATSSVPEDHPPELSTLTAFAATTVSSTSTLSHPAEEVMGSLWDQLGLVASVPSLRSPVYIYKRQEGVVRLCM